MAGVFLYLLARIGKREGGLEGVLLTKPLAYKNVFQPLRNRKNHHEVTIKKGEPPRKLFRDPKNTLVAGAMGTPQDFKTGVIGA